MTAKSQIIGKLAYSINVFWHIFQELSSFLAMWPMKIFLLSLSRQVSSDNRAHGITRDSWSPGQQHSLPWHSLGAKWLQTSIYGLGS